MSMKWMVVIYHKGKRVEKVVEDPRPYLPKVKALKGKGLKANIIPMKAQEARYFPPVEDDMEKLNQGMMWCPYCGDWRWFAVPPYRPRAEIGTKNWDLNIFATQGIRICQWCTISAQDWYVKRANGLFGEVEGSGKRRRRKPKVRR